MIIDKTNNEDVHEILTDVEPYIQHTVIVKFGKPLQPQASADVQYNRLLDRYTITLSTTVEQNPKPYLLHEIGHVVDQYRTKNQYSEQEMFKPLYKIHEDKYNELIDYAENTNKRNMLNSLTVNKVYYMDESEMFSRYFQQWFNKNHTDTGFELESYADVIAKEVYSADFGIIDDYMNILTTGITLEKSLQNGKDNIIKR